MFFPSPSVEDGKSRFQPHSREYDWLVPDLTRDTRERYITIFLAVLITAVTDRPSV